MLNRTEKDSGAESPNGQIRGQPPSLAIAASPCSRKFRRNLMARRKLDLPTPLRPISTVTGERLTLTSRMLLKLRIVMCSIIRSYRLSPKSLAEPVDPVEYLL